MIVFDAMGHLVSTEGEEELHAFARRLGLKPLWYQDDGSHPHYDLTTVAMRGKAAGYGAVEVRPTDLVRLAWWRKPGLASRPLPYAPSPSARRVEA